MRTATGAMATDEAIETLRAHPGNRILIETLYLDDDPDRAAARFAASAEFAAVVGFLGPSLSGAVVLDLGAGTGVAAAALVAAGAREVLAVEPDSSEVVGYGRLSRTTTGLPVTTVAAVAEALPVATSSIDIVYGRQVLHHTTDLDQAVSECARVLRPSGCFVACREHVVDDDRQLTHFLATHPVHQLAGGEHAYPLPAYRQAIVAAGLQMQRELGPWDSVINAYPTVQQPEDLAKVPEIVLGGRFGRTGRIIGSMPVARRLTWARLRRPKPGRFYSFIATKS